MSMADVIEAGYEEKIAKLQAKLDKAELLQEFYLEGLNRSADELDKAKEILEIIMTQHWDMAACKCWICVKARAIGCHPMEKYLRRNLKETLAQVRVEQALKEVQP